MIHQQVGITIGIELIKAYESDDQQQMQATSFMLMETLTLLETIMLEVI